MNGNKLNEDLMELIFEFSRSMKERTAVNPSTNHLSILQLHALIFIKRHETANMSEIAEYFKIELPTATTLLNKLSKEKLVKRQSDKKDRRLVQISLSKAGELLLTKAKILHMEKINVVLSYLSLTEKKSLLKILKTLTDKMENSI